MRILLVEDNTGQRRLISNALTSYDPEWQAEELESGEEALQHLSDGEEYDVVLLDYNLPGKNGLEILGEIRKSETAPPVVMVTGQGDEQIAVEAMKAGAHDYLPKSGDYLERLPLSVHRAAKAHQLVLERRRIERSLRESEEFASSLLNNSPNPIIVVNPDTSVRFVNPAFEELTGFFTSEVVGRWPPLPWWPEEFQDEVDQRFREVFRGGGYRVEELFQKKNGERFWVEINSTPVRRDGQLKYFIATWMDITERKRAEEALRQSEEKYRTLTESSLTGVFIIQDEKFVFVNRRFAEMHGYERDEVIGMDDVKLVHPDDRETVQQRVSRKIKGEARSDHYQMRGWRKDGSSFWLEMTSAAIEYNGRPAVMGHGVNITEQKQAQDRIRASLEEKETLLREIHHRVKNNLQIVSSLLRRQGRQIQDETLKELLKESENRVLSMSLIHEKLYRSENMAAINFKEFIRSLSHSLIRSYGISNVSLKSDIEDVHLPIDTAIPCGLIVNELVSNSLKYAFPEGKSGEIEIGLHQIGEGEVELMVRDNGAGMSGDIDIRNTDSLGMDLVTLLGEKQLGGKVELDRSQGTEFRIRFQY
ncbi:MAG: PAS domain S-box protein [Dehalococcoidia bacterium]